MDYVVTCAISARAPAEKKFGRDFVGIFSNPPIKAQIFEENFETFFVRKFVVQYNIFGPRFALQTCHLNAIVRNRYECYELSGPKHLLRLFFLEVTSRGKTQH